VINGRDDIARRNFGGDFRYVPALAFLNLDFSLDILVFLPLESLPKNISWNNAVQNYLVSLPSLLHLCESFLLFRYNMGNGRIPQFHPIAGNIRFP
jgi:hypothetical protein